MAKVKTNSFKIVKHDEDKNHLFVEFTVNGKVESERFDGRYIPLDDIEELNGFLSRHLSGLVAGANDLIVSPDLKGAIGKSKELTDEEIAVIEDQKSQESGAIDNPPSVDEEEKSE